MGEAFDRLQALLRRETSYSELLAAHVLSPPPVQQRSSSFRAIGEGVSEEDDDWVLTASDRSQMVEWGYHVADYLNAPRDAIMVGMSFVDRLVAAWPVITERNYKLLVVASFFLSMKILHRNKLQIDFLCRLSSFSKKDIFSMESTILSHLEWKVHPPCATEFLRLYIENLDLPRAKLQAIEADATFYIEQSLFDSFFIPFCASQIAMAAFLNASLKRLTEAEASKVATLFDAGVEVYSCRVQLTKIMVQNQPSRDWDRKSPVSTASLDEEKKKWG